MVSLGESVRAALLPAWTQNWAQVVTREATTPVFPKLPAAVRPFLLATVLLAAVNAALYAGDAALLRYGLSWTLVSLLLVVATASLWGIRPAILALALSAVYGAIVVPKVSPAHVAPDAVPRQALLLRSALFVACGVATIYLTHRARQMQEKAEIRRGVVTTLQSMILPATLADAPGYDLCGVYRPAHTEEQVGGDFYDLYPIGEGVYGVLIGDVMGKGKEAAVSTALLRYSVRAFTSAGMCPAQVIYELNRLIDQQESDFAMATLFLGFLDTHTRTLCYASAGHEPPMLLRANGDEEELDTTGPVLGTRLLIGYGEITVTLAAGDTLLLMTDGVTEARNAQRKFLGRAGTAKRLQIALNAPSACEALAAFDAALQSYIGSSRCDDIAMLLLRGLPT